MPPLKGEETNPARPLPIDAVIPAQAGSQFQAPTTHASDTASRNAVPTAAGAQPMYRHDHMHGRYDRPHHRRWRRHDHWRGYYWHGRNYWHRGWTCHWRHGRRTCFYRYW